MKRFVCFIFVLCSWVIGSAFADSINIHWYANNSVYDTTTCTIGDTVTPPTAPVPKYGYHFSGWKPLYTQLEYIESTGDQYIDTGIKPSTGYKVRVKAYATALPTTAGVFFGCTSTANAENAFKGIYRIIGGHIDRVAWGDGNGSVIGGLSGNDAVNTWYDMVCDNGAWSINGTLFATVPVSSFTAEYSMWLFARNTGGTLGLPMPCRISVCQVWDNYGQMVINLVPAKRNDNNAIGMYDTVTDTFFENAGTGVFIAGPESGSTQ